MESLKRSFSKGEWSNAGSHSGSWVSQEGFISPKDPGIMCRKVRECIIGILQHWGLFLIIS